MSKYLLLQDHFIAGQVLAAGTTQSTVDVGGLLPVGWIPTPNVDPLDTPAVNAFYAVAPVQPSPTIYIKPVTYWVAPAASQWSQEFSYEFGNLPGQRSLTGLGAALAPINI